MEPPEGWEAEDLEGKREMVAALKADFPWLYTARAVRSLGVPMRNQYAHLVRGRLQLLMDMFVPGEGWGGAGMATGPPLGAARSESPLLQPASHGLSSLFAVCGGVQPAQVHEVL